YLGGILRVRKGQKVRVLLRNELPGGAENIVHWHGLHVPHEADGHPLWGIAKGETYVYEFEVANPAATLMYHSHTHGVTARQVYAGLAGLLLIGDDEERRLGLPSGDYDLPVVIQDRAFDDDNQFRYADGHMETMMGFLGDQILVNGQRNFVLPVNTRAYRLRLVNASNARIYKLGWSDGTPLTVIGTDGGLLDKPVTRPFVVLAPGERLELWADFSGRAVGSEMTLRSLPFGGVYPAMHERMMGGGQAGEGGRGGMGMMGHGGGGGMGMTQHGGDGNRGAQGEHGGMGMMGGKQGQGGGGMGMMQHGDEGSRAGQGEHGGMGMMGGGQGQSGGKGEHGGMGMMGGKSGQGGGGMGMMQHGDEGSRGGQGGHGGMGMMGGGQGMGTMHGASLAMGADFPVLKVHVMQEEKHSDRLPERLVDFKRLNRQEAANAANPRVFRLTMEHMRWGLNGKSFEMEAADAEETVPLNSMQVIEFDNGHTHGGGMGGMMHMAHPMHLHGQTFQILKREMSGTPSEAYRDLSRGFVDEGWKDTVLVMPGEKVTILKRFDDFPGLFLFHCHILEHEEMGMMRNFLVK
ncbi:MAG TPA: multicopper oxidase domain-containing protein, partial [Methylococcaceae bacterium]|nr:multicopper oxidase domain-containing protein [Methylococcaceae bacterium]